MMRDTSCATTVEEEVAVIRTSPAMKDWAADWIIHVAASGKSLMMLQGHSCRSTYGKRLMSRPYIGVSRRRFNEGHP